MKYTFFVNIFSFSFCGLFGVWWATPDSLAGTLAWDENHVFLFLSVSHSLRRRLKERGTARDNGLKFNFKHLYFHPKTSTRARLSIVCRSLIAAPRCCMSVRELESFAVFFLTERQLKNASHYVMIAQRANACDSAHKLRFGHFNLFI